MEPIQYSYSFHLSMEPLLGPVDLSTWFKTTMKCNGCGEEFEMGDLSQVVWHEDHAGPKPEFAVREGVCMNRIGWVIIGGESGPRSRPCQLE